MKLIRKQPENIIVVVSVAWHFLLVLLLLVLAT